jgi:hypothetical protein
VSLIEEEIDPVVGVVVPKPELLPVVGSPEVSTSLRQIKKKIHPSEKDPVPVASHSKVCVPVGGSFNHHIVAL